MMSVRTQAFLQASTKHGFDFLLGAIEMAYSLGEINHAEHSQWLKIAYAL